MKCLKPFFTPLFLFVFLYFNPTFASSNDSANTCQEDDYIALRAFYLATGGDDWSDNSNWPDAAFFEANPILPVGIVFDNWYGIIVNDNGCVEEIRFFYDNNISGPLPPEIENLNHLERLIITRNQINKIPDEIGNINTLESINLWENAIDSIPATIGNLNNLTNLYLNNNQISGSLPPELGNLENLVWLNIRLNQLSGCFDDNLLGLCGQFSDDFNTFDMIDAGNNFITNWDTFCENGGQVCVECNENNYIALRALYLATDGDNWTHRDNWPDAAFFTANPTVPYIINYYDWFGLVTNGDGCVTGFNLSGNNLTGFIPPEIGNLTELGFIKFGDSSFGGNQLSGTIPEELTNLTRLGFIDINNNQISGSLPSDIGNLTNLAQLHLNNNQISGTLPASMSNMSNLERLHLDNNQITGPIPPDFFNLPSIIQIYLNDNQITGSIPPEIGNLTVSRLELTNNQLTGSIPPEIGNANIWSVLSLGNNQLSGEIPPEIANLNVTSLYLDNNQLTGQIPGSIATMENLEYLRINNNQMSGCFHPFLGNLCNLVGEGVAFMSTGNNFDDTWYNFCNNGGGSCPITISPCQEDDYIALRALYLNTDGNNWNDRTNWPSANFFNNNPTLPEGGLNVHSWHGIRTNENYCVTEIYLSNNHLNGTLPEEIGLLSEAKEITIRGDWQLAGSIPSGIADLDNVTFFDLSDNQIQGQIPTEVSDMEKLEYLALHRNLLTGAIPPEIGNISNLEYLLLSDNQLEGDIPNTLGNLSYLVRLYLSDNQLEGNIPGWLGNLTSLTGLYLDENQFTGSIPIEIGNLSELEYLHLEENDLSGCFHQNLEIFCSLPPSNIQISQGNNFDVTWEEFCATGEGTCYPACVGTGYEVLRTLYLTTDGDNWTNRTNWPNAEYFEMYPFPGFGTDMGTWHGITTDAEGCITQINLNNNNLVGSIPDALLQLEELTTLHLADNNFSGDIPIFIGNMTGLTRLELANNQFTGCYEPSLYNLCNQLEAAYNINAAISDGNSLATNWEDFCNTQVGICTPCRDNDYTALRALYLNTDGGSWGTAASWPNLDFFINNPTPPNTLDVDTWTGITTNEYGCVVGIDLSMMGLKGCLPSELGLLKYLNGFTAIENEIAGTIPPTLRNLDYLNDVFIGYNQMGGCFAPELTDLCGEVNFPLLEELNHFDATWSDFCNNGAGTCTSLLPCDAADAYISFRALYLSTDGDNWYNNTNWPNAAYFNTNPTLPIGIDMSDWYGLMMNDEECITRLYLPNNNLVGNIPPEISNLNSLQELFLQNNQLTTIPAEIGDLANLHTLYLFDNQLEGNIPPEIGNLDNLVHLNLAQNQFSGQIPAQMSQMDNIHFLHLNDNLLLGCYESQLSFLCPGWGLSLQSSISEGNDFNATWEEFCDDGGGECGPVSPCAQNDYKALRAFYLNAGRVNSSPPGWPTMEEFLANPEAPDGTYLGAWNGVTVNSDGCVNGFWSEGIGWKGSIPLNLRH